MRTNFRCMEDQTSMTRTATQDGQYWQYDGYLEVHVTTPLVIGSGGSDYQVATTQAQVLNRAVKFLAPKTLTFNLTQQSLRIWSADLVVPLLVFDHAVWGNSTTSSLIVLKSRIINPWTLRQYPNLAPTPYVRGLGGSAAALGVSTTNYQMNTLCNNGKVDQGVCEQYITFRVCV